MLVSCVLGLYIITLAKKYSAEGVSTAKLKTNIDIVFPNEDIDVPKCTNNRTFCEDVDNYPFDKLYAVLKTNNYSSKEFSFDNTVVSNRFLNDNEYYICSSRKKIYFPRVAYNLNRKPRFIFNLEGYKQAVFAEECVNEGSSCKSLKGILRDKKTQCMQLEQTVLLLVADEEGLPIWDSFLFPSYCVCNYSPVINFLENVKNQTHSSSHRELIHVSARSGKNSQYWAASESDFSSDLAFPNSAESNDNLLYVKLIPKCPKNQTFCETLPEYPSDIFDKTLNMPDHKTKYLNIPQLLENEIIDIRSHESNCLCPSVSVVVYPKAAYNIRNELKFVFNLDNYKQGIKISYCVKEAKCKFFEKIRDYRTKCKQKYTERRLLTADGDAKPYMDRYKFASGCVCSYTRDPKYSRISRLERYKQNLKTGYN